MNDEHYLLLLIIPVFIFALFVWQTWNDSRHHHRCGKWGEPKLVSVMVAGVERDQARFQERYCETCGMGEAKRMSDPQ